MVDDDNNNVIDFPKWLQYTAMILTLVAIVFCAVSWLFVYYYQKKPIVAMGQTVFLYNVCFGAMIVASSNLFYLPVIMIDYTRITPDMKMTLNICCNLAIWFAFMGILVLYTALLCKMYRTMKIKQQPLRRGLLVLPKYVMGPYIVVVLVGLGLLIAMSAFDPSRYNNSIDSDVETDGSPQGFCSSNKRKTGIYYFCMILLLEIVQFILLMLACKIRNINKQLADSTRIFRLLLFHLLINILNFVVLFTIEDGRLTESNATVIIAAVFLIPIVNSLPAIGFMIGPRMYYVWYERKNGHLPESVEMIGTGTVAVRVNDRNDNGNGNDNDNDNDNGNGNGNGNRSNKNKKNIRFGLHHSASEVNVEIHNDVYCK